MHRNAIKFKDTWAAPGSQLHQALVDQNLKLAERIYRQCEDDNQKLAKSLVQREGRAQ
ncbi:hypothetical protein ACODYM_28880 [Burkholderia gladioli]|uniref:hypothetical protein n=1 Tax=Burkholderia gladioli TaxID=28095 RepID=UPI003B50D290